MELQIQDLITSIKKEGIDVAQKEADVIVTNAKREAESIVEEAKNEAKRIKENSEKEIEVLKNSAVINAQQAQRDAVLSFKSEVQKEYEKILAADVRSALSDETLAKLITAVLAEEDMSLYSVEVAEVSETLKAQLADKMKNGLEIRTSKEIKAGFRLNSKDGSGYFDCTDEEISKMLMPFFSKLSF